MQRARSRDIVGRLDDETLHELLLEFALHPIRVILGFVMGLTAAIVFLVLTSRADLAPWVATLGPLGTAISSHFVVRAAWKRRARDAGLPPNALALVRTLVHTSPLPLTPTSDSVDAFIAQLRR